MPFSPEVEACPPLAFAWEWDKSEYIRLHRALMREVWRTQPARLIRNAILLLTVGLVVAAVTQLLQGDHDVLRAYFPWMLIFIFWWATFRWLLPHVNARAYRKVHRGELRLLLDEEGVESGCEVCTNRMRWSAFSRAVETPEFIFLFYTPQCAMYLPKRAMSSAEGEHLFRSTVQSRLPGLSPR